MGVVRELKRSEFAPGAARPQVEIDLCNYNRVEFSRVHVMMLKTMAPSVMTKFIKRQIVMTREYFVTLFGCPWLRVRVSSSPDSTTACGTNEGRMT